MIMFNLNFGGCFNIDVSIRNSFPHFSETDKCIKRITTSSFWNFVNPYTIMADPFLFVYEDRLYLFYEAKRYLNHGEIQMVYTKDLKHWSKPETILRDKNIHFSYPFIIEDHGSIYLIPETECDHSIRVYKAQNNDLTEFTFVKKIIERTSNFKSIKYDYADSSILHKDGLYYLITSYHTGKSYHSLLYFSDSLLGNYAPVLNKPICNSLKYGRCGGGFLNIGTKLYRAVQDCENSYGENVHLMEVTEITSESYQEYLAIENILPKTCHPFECGGHQVSIVKFHDNIIVATDYREIKPFFIPKITKKLMRYAHLKSL